MEDKALMVATSWLAAVSIYGKTPDRLVRVGRSPGYTSGLLRSADTFSISGASVT